MCRDSEIEIDYKNKLFKTIDKEIKEGDLITIDGSTGRIIVESKKLNQKFEEIF